MANAPILFNGQAAKLLKDILKSFTQGSIYFRSSTPNGVVSGTAGDLAVTSAGLFECVSGTTWTKVLITTDKGAANGVASLDSNGKVPSAQLPNSVMEYVGLWNASTNSPTLADGTGNNGDVYRVSTAGTQDLGHGSESYAVGDLVIYNGTTDEWEQSPDPANFSFATRQLDNLLNTAVNAIIKPDTDGTIDFGTSTLHWNSIYGRSLTNDTNGFNFDLQNATLTFDGSQTALFGTRNLLDSSEAPVLDWQNRALYYPNSTQVLEFSSNGVAAITVNDNLLVQNSVNSSRIRIKPNGGSGIATILESTATTTDKTLTLPNATDTLVGKATTDTFINKTFNTAGTGNSFQINGTSITAVTGTGAVVLASSPTLTTPNLGTPSAVTLTNGTGLPISTGVTGLGTGIATFLGTPSSANLAAAVTDETGTGALVFASSPSLTTPNLGTPSAVTLTNATGLPLTTGVTGTLPVANGGTGTTNGSITGTTALTFTAGGTNQDVNLTPSGTGKVLANSDMQTSGSFITAGGVVTSTGALTISSATAANVNLNPGAGGDLTSNATSINFSGSTLSVNSVAATTVSTNSVSGSSAVTVSAGGTNQSITLTPTGTGAVAINTTATSRNNTSLQIKDGVGFPATQVASTDPNTLDDYEEGTWTPSLGGTATYTAQEGTYTKIGNLVQIHGRIQVNSIGTGSTTNISGLPFTVSGTTSGFVGFANNTSSSIVSASLLFNNATTTCDIYSRTAASTTTTTNAIFTASTNVYFSGSYRV